MEENKNRIVHGKLNLNVPPLSTRRVSGPTASHGSIPEPANMVPFSWERVPGEPKNRPTNENSSSVSRPKPPPGWRQPRPRVENPGSGSGSDEEINSRNEHFSDAIDIFSLAESVDDVEAYCKATKDRSSAMAEAETSYVSSSFIIERFLPDAQALAEESVMNKKVPFSDSDSDSNFSRVVSIRRSHPSMKGCGLGSLLPWKMKPKACSVKGPVCDTIIGSNLKQKW